MTVSLLNEIPEELNDAISVFLEQHSDWDRDRFMTAAIALFLLQSGDVQRRKVSRIYLDTVFGEATA